MFNLPKHIILAIFSIIIFFIYLLVYYPGLYGSFIFDDYANLNKLGNYNGVRNLDTFLKYIGNGIAGPSGRPISLLSFLLNGTNWPTDPYPFKLTNILLHGLTGFFLFLLCRLIFLSFKLNSQQAFIAALITTCFWLLHPFFVSTVLYVVQRMAMLSAFFSIIGLWLYSKGRLLLIDNTLQNHNRKAYIYMSLGLGLGTLLAILSKENGVLLPLSAACLEICIFSHPKAITKPLNRYWACLFLLLPSLFIFGYLIYQVNPYHFSHPFGNRNFNLPERLLTESKIVCGYLYALLIPKLSYPGLLYENIMVSKGLWQPPQTAFSVLLIVALLISAFYLRKQAPFYALAVLFFFAGHFLESTTIPLELYFEHRNYYPAIFLFLPAGYYFATRQNKLIKTLIVIILLVCPLFTYQLSKLWGNEIALTLFWAKQNPASSRAQRTAALALENKGNKPAALSLISQARANIPDSLDLHWHWFLLKCETNTVTSRDFEEIKKISQKLPFTAYHFNILEATIQFLINQQCPGLNSADALGLLDNLMNNPGIKGDQRLLFQPHHLKGLVFATMKRPKEALAEYSTVLDLTQNVEHGLVQVGVLGSQGYFKEALEHLNAVDEIFKTQPSPSSNHLKTKPDYQVEIARIRATLLEDIQKQNAPH